MARVYVSLGSNIERRRNLRHALDALNERYGPLTCSEVYESEAVGFDSDPFYNLVVGFDTDETPRDIQQALHAMESASGPALSAVISRGTWEAIGMPAARASAASTSKTSGLTNS